MASRTWTFIGRGLRGRCPLCGDGRIFKTYLDHHERCGVCGLRFEREQGYFTGGMEICTIAAFLVPIIACFTVGRWIHAPDIVWIALSVAVSLRLYQPTRGLWLAIDLLADPIDGGPRPPGDESAPRPAPAPRPSETADVK